MIEYIAITQTIDNAAEWTGKIRRTQLPPTDRYNVVVGSGLSMNQ